MNIRELINKDLIEIGAEYCSKNEAIERLIRLQKNNGAIHNPRALRREIRAQEEQGCSAVSCRVAIPCTAHSGAAKTAISAVTVRDGIDYGAPDKRPVKLIFLIAGKSGTDEYLEAKERLMHLLNDPVFTARLCGAKSKEEFLTLLAEREKVRFSDTRVKRRSRQL